ncbi:hypothetical protein B0H15DRAFT_163818 [Mycena belliarum]|uniref:Uncharacterized protein n=1 Tax=Mycena belliarum TaxID=1033014 RepID=A0AAD6U6J5_9AGAR|nr:hypothetical protein B0H15DRAFT_163818 [Mycena belliae]
MTNPWYFASAPADIVVFFLQVTPQSPRHRLAVRIPIILTNANHAYSVSSLHDQTHTRTRIISWNQNAGLPVHPTSYLPQILPESFQPTPKLLTFDHFLLPSAGRALFRSGQLSLLIDGAGPANPVRRLARSSARIWTHPTVIVKLYLTPIEIPPERPAQQGSISDLQPRNPANIGWESACAFVYSYSNGTCMQMYRLGGDRWGISDYGILPSRGWIVRAFGHKGTRYASAEQWRPQRIAQRPKADG